MFKVALEKKMLMWILGSLLLAVILSLGALSMRRAFRQKNGQIKQSMFNVEKLLNKQKQSLKELDQALEQLKPLSKLDRNVLFGDWSKEVSQMAGRYACKMVSINPDEVRPFKGTVLVPAVSVFEASWADGSRFVYELEKLDKPWVILSLDVRNSSDQENLLIWSLTLGWVFLP